ncbi:Origin recognition complex subunit 2 [Varicellaria rhodocarpa]|nr:Origin recognition complex subunit 2 [Varicellaria rhodocarpa]
MKRRRAIGEDELQQEDDITPKRLRSRLADGTISGSTNNTPSRRSSTRANKSAKETVTLLDPRTPKANTPSIKGKLLFTTPNKPRTTTTLDVTPSTLRNADRSARRKSARRLIERTITGDMSDENDLDEDELAKDIWEEEETEEEGIQPNSENIPDADSLPDTPSKRTPGRLKGARRKRFPTAPQNLPPHEQYFFQNRPGGNKTSGNAMSSLSMLTHSSYHSHIANYVDPHTSSFSFLHSLHSSSFALWILELNQSFSVCLYGYGSKRRLTTTFVNHLHSTKIPESPPPTTIIVNGYIPSITPSQILTTVISTLPKSSFPSNLTTDPSALLILLTTHLTAHPASRSIYIILNSLDAPSLRAFKTQSLLATLASHPSICFLATCDTPSFPLLWDVSLRDRFNWVFHDTTTFIPFDDGNGTGEVGGVVDILGELIGRKGVGGKDREGVRWVLRSLPENARGLYRTLIAELLASTAEDEAGPGHNDALEEDLEEDLSKRKTPRKRLIAEDTVGIEYRVLYQKAVEEFLCSGEMAFRTLLKEFHDHQMIVSRRDGAGGEVLGVPLRKEEMEGVLEDLMG